MKFILLIVFFATPAFATHPSLSSCASEQEIADELVRRELSGGRLTGARSVCLKQSVYKHILANNNGVDEQPDQPRILPDRTPVRVVVSKTQVTKAGEKIAFEDPNDRRAEYFATINGKEERIGSLAFTLFLPGSPMHKRFGCAGVFSPPKRLYIWEPCFRREND
jgi:hypothetical protein